MSVKAKICGLNTLAAVRAAATADFAGFVFYPPSPRYVTAKRAAVLAKQLPRRIQRVALMVDPDDAALRAALVEFRPDFLQLHGHESPARVAHIRRAFSLPIVKAIPVREAGDLDAADAYLDAADWLLFDARPPAQPGALPGGNAEPFDWRLLTGRSWKLPWMLSGGLNAKNLGEAVGISGARAVDVSSGVEDRPGHKLPGRIKAFLAAAAKL
ncbi:MAG: phosphoribosylanthranilate isomerase [Rhodospirillales bacterium]|nr:phosphoribosylanthranilate isomerase [Rhodospirillales bacterium]